MLKKTKAHSIGEYAVLTSIVVAVAVTLTPMIRRGTQSLIKAGADQIGVQNASDQDFSPGKGYTDSMHAVSKTNFVDERRDWPGAIQSAFNSSTETQTETTSNIGFTKEE